MISDPLVVLTTVKQIRKDKFLNDQFENGNLKIKVRVMLYLSIETDDQEIKDIIKGKIKSMGFVERNAVAISSTEIYPHGFYRIQDDQYLNEIC